MKNAAIVLVLPLVALFATSCDDDHPGPGAGGAFSGCGDQLAYEKDYETLGRILSDDVLVIDMSQPRMSCGYLGVEARENSCGGRDLNDDVVDISYSAFALGKLNGVTDGVDVNDKVFNPEFPYLLAPN